VAPANASRLQYLMLGDSISLGMKNGLSALLAPHDWELTHNPGNANNANFGQHCLTDWLRLETRHWDVISFNFGLHDIAYKQERLTAEQYKRLLTNITTTLVDEQKGSGTKLLWVTTTPVPNNPVYDPNGPCSDYKKCINPPRFDNDVILYNSIAAGIMADARRQGADIATVDLYSFVVEQCGGPGYTSCSGFQLPHNVHFTSKGWSAMSEQMAQALLTLDSAKHVV